MEPMHRNKPNITYLLVRNLGMQNSSEPYKYYFVHSLMLVVDGKLSPEVLKQIC